MFRKEAEEEKSSSRAMTFSGVLGLNGKAWVAQKREAGGVIEIPSKT